jgi:nucleotide-binding universal stress UspA family protein
MSTYKMRILLALDGSDQSLEAARYVSKLVLPNRLEIVLFHVRSKIPESFWDIEKNPTYRHQLAPIAAWSTQEESRIQEFMEEARQIFFDQGVPEKSVTIKIQEKEEGVARDILREAQNDYRMVAVGRWGVSKLKDLVWGSIANKLVGHLSQSPLCVVGGTPRPGKLLIAMDSSPDALRTVEYVGAMLAKTDWQVSLFHVIRGVEDWMAEAQEEFYQAEKTIVDLFEQAIARLKKAGVKADLISTKTVTRVPSRAKAIYEEARHGGYGTIVVGRRGLSRVEDFFIGRVSNKVMQLAKDMAVWVVN